MTLINDLFRGLIALSILAMMQYGCTVKGMAKSAAKAHQKGLTSYGDYSKMLTGKKGSWAEDTVN